MTETLKNTPDKQGEHDLPREYQALHEQLEKRRSQETEKATREKDVKSTAQEALKEAKESQSPLRTEKTAKRPERSRPLSRKELDHAFNNEMSAIRLHMSPVSRSFSKVIHNKTIEKVSDIAGNTIARPNAILTGSLAAFIMVLGVYLIAKYFGYSLSGSETMITFLLGWMIGLIIDYIRSTLRGRSS